MRGYVRKTISLTFLAVSGIAIPFLPFFGGGARKPLRVESPADWSAANDAWKAKSEELIRQRIAERVRIEGNTDRYVAGWPPHPVRVTSAQLERFFPDNRFYLIHTHDTYGYDAAVVYSVSKCGDVEELGGEQVEMSGPIDHQLILFAPQTDMIDFTAGWCGWLSQPMLRLLGRMPAPLKTPEDSRDLVKAIRQLRDCQGFRNEIHDESGPIDLEHKSDSPSRFFVLREERAWEVRIPDPAKTGRGARRDRWRFELDNEGRITSASICFDEPDETLSAVTPPQEPLS